LLLPIALECVLLLTPFDGLELNRGIPIPFWFYGLKAKSKGAKSRIPGGEAPGFSLSLTTHVVQSFTRWIIPACTFPALPRVLHYIPEAPLSGMAGGRLQRAVMWLQIRV
jgi:hypothetical protein